MVAPAAPRLFGGFSTTRDAPHIKANINPIQPTPMRAAFANMMGWTPILTVNVGAGTPEAACNRAEGCSCPRGPTGLSTSLTPALNFKEVDLGTRPWHLRRE